MHLDNIFPLKNNINIYRHISTLPYSGNVSLPGQIISTYLVEILSTLGLDLSKLCKSIFLDRYTEVISIFYLWNMESYPNSNIRRVF